MSSDLESNDVMAQNQLSTVQPIMLIKDHLHCDLAIDLEGQDHILFPMTDYVEVHVKINSIVGLPVVTIH